MEYTTVATITRKTKEYDRVQQKTEITIKIAKKNKDSTHPYHSEGSRNLKFPKIRKYCLSLWKSIYFVKTIPKCHPNYRKYAYKSRFKKFGEFL